MNSTTRYILTATAVGAGLLTIGATANALSGSPASDTAAIGPAVVLPSADPLSSTGVGPIEVTPPGGSQVNDLAAGSTPTTGSTGWATSTSPAGGVGERNGAETEGGDD